MEWEKQDNELRKLMEDGNFLPEGENWDAAHAWQKLRKANDGATKYKRRWLPLAVAACAAGLVGIFFWWSLPSSTSGTVASNKSLASPSANAVSPAPLPLATVSEKTTNENSGKSAAWVAAKAQPASGAVVGTQPPLVEQGKDTLAAVSAKTDMAGSFAPPAVDGPVLPAMVPPASPPNTNTAALPIAKKPAIRVLHYNTINSSSPVVPPVFVQLSRSASQWNMQEMLPAENAKHPAVMLKIDLSPVPKKSL